MGFVDFLAEVVLENGGGGKSAKKGRFSKKERKQVNSLKRQFQIP